MSTPSTARAWVLPKGSTGGPESFRLVEFPLSRPARGEVLVKIRAASLNYRDLLISIGQYPHSEPDEGLILLSDAAGDIIEIGEDVTDHKVGDRVHTVFQQQWLIGPPTPSNMRFSLGGDIQGCLIEYRTFPSHGVVPIPEHLSYEEASTIPCTGVIAYASLFAGHDRVGPESDVLVLGTGGVSIWGLQLAKAAGARVIATSSNDVKIEKLKELGADETINYVKTPDWASEVKRLTGGRGVDHVLEIGGPGTLIPAIKSVRMGGHVYLIGFGIAKNDENGANAGNASLAAIVGFADLHGMRTGNREMTISLGKVLARHSIRPIVDKVFAFEEAKSAWVYQRTQKHFGKVVIRFDIGEHGH